jgi:SH3-like domain-containing protein
MDGTSGGKGGLARRHAALLLAGAAAALAWPVRADETGDGTATAESGADGLDAGAAPSDAASDAADAQPRNPDEGSVTHLPLPRYVSLKTNQGNARRGPGLTHRIDWVFTRAGMPLKVTAEYEHWRRVEDQDGAGGWVHYSLLSGVRTVLVTTDMTEFRDSADPQASVVYQAELNVIGKLLQAAGDWARVAVEGEKGWAKKADLWGVDPGETFN